MERAHKAIDKGGGLTLYRTTLTDRQSTGSDKDRRRVQFLQELLTDGWAAGLLATGPKPFERMKVEYTGAAWVVVLEAEEQLRPGDML